MEWKRPYVCASVCAFIYLSIQTENTASLYISSCWERTRSWWWEWGQRGIPAMNDWPLVNTWTKYSSSIQTHVFNPIKEYIWHRTISTTDSVVVNEILFYKCLQLNEYIACCASWLTSLGTENFSTINLMRGYSSRFCKFLLISVFSFIVVINKLVKFEKGPTESWETKARVLTTKYRNSMQREKWPYEIKNAISFKVWK